MNPILNPFPRNLSNTTNTSLKTYTLGREEHGDGWEISFFLDINKPEVYIYAYRDGERLANIRDELPNGTIVNYDEWIPISIARDYWNFLVNVADYKRSK